MRLSRRLERLAEFVPIDHLRDAVEPVSPDLPSVDHLRNLLGGDGIPDDLEPELLVTSGKVPRLRTLLVALSARAVGAREVDPDLQHAAEMLYLGLTLHDVALGRTSGRRRRVARRIVRRSADWLGGNHLTLRALELVRYVPRPELVGEAIDTLRAFSEGQALARELQRGDDLPERDDWRDHVDAHAGALYAFCCRAGGRLGTDDDALLAALGRYGRHVGRACSVAQDAIALSDPTNRAEHLVDRALIGRPILPVVAAIEADPSLGRAWLELVRDPEVEAAGELADRVLVHGLPASRDVLTRAAFSARQALQLLPESPYRYGMERLASGIAQVPLGP